MSTENTTDRDDRHAGIVREATDLCWKATPFGEDADGFITNYLLPAGVVHRLLGQIQGAGYPASFRVPSARADKEDCLDHRLSIDLTSAALLAAAEKVGRIEALAERYIEIGCPTLAADIRAALDGSR